MIRAKIMLVSIVLTVSSTAIVLGATGSPASATHQRGANSGVLNSRTWTVCASGWLEGRNATSHAIGQVDRTEVWIYSVNCTGSYNVSSYSGSFPDNWYGLTTCLTAVVNGQCGYKEVRLNGRVITTPQNWNMNACHEFGHVAGLGHRTVNESCVATGASPPRAETFDQHDIEAINETY